MELDYKALSDNFNKLSEQIINLKKQMKDQSKVIIEKGAKEIFDSYPFINNIFWTQYTPYFNDGEACIFNVHEIAFTLQEHADSEDGEEDDFCEYEGSTLYNSKDLESAQKDYAIVESFEKDPAAWRENYKKEYKEKYNREYSNHWRENSLKPYPSSTMAAQNKINKIEAFLKKYDVKEIDAFSKSFDEFCSMINKVESDVMEMLFGDHVKIVISRDGIDIDEYQHD